MKPTRKAVRDAAVAILRDEATGFNARMEALSEEYGVEEFKIDFNAGSKSFVQAALEIEGDDIEYSQVLPGPLALTLYTTEARNLGKQNSPFFSGEIALRLDAYLIFRRRNRSTDSIEWDDTETVADAVEEALLLALNDNDAAWDGVTYNHIFASERGPARLFGDGWEQRLSLILACEVHV